jgi:hypothetical protein
MGPTGRILTGMKKFMFAWAALLGLLVFSAAAADVTGKYTAEVAGRGGNTMTQTFNLTAAGDALTGTVVTPRGEVPITDGKISGDTLSFTTVMKFQDREMKMTYTGTVAGDSIKFSRQREGADQKQEFTATKVH